MTAYQEAWALFAHHGLFGVPTRVTRLPNGRKKVENLVDWRAGGFYDGQRDAGELERAWAGHEDATALAIFVGKRAGVVALDPDTPEAEEYVRRHGVPRTASFRSLRGVKRLFRYPEGVELSTGHLVDGLELRADYLLFVPPTPGYEWLPSATIDEAGLAPLPDWARRNGRRKPPVEIRLGPDLPPGEAHDATARTIGKLARSLSAGELWTTAKALNAGRLPEGELEDLVRAIAGREAAKEAGPGDPPLNGQPRRHPLTLRSFPELLAANQAAGPRQWDVEGVLVHGQHGALGSTPKAGKGWDVVDLAVAIASGTEWLGHFACPNRGPVALFPGEEDDHELERRFVAVGEARGVNVRDLPVHIASDTPRFRRAEDLDVFRKELEAVRPRVSIVDPMYKSVAGGDPKLLAVMGELLSAASDIARELGSSFVTIPHFNRDTSRKGAERFTGAGPAEWGRFLIAATVTKRRQTEHGGTEVVRSVEISGTSIRDRTFVVVRKITPVDPADPDSPLVYEVRVDEADAAGGASPDLDYSLRCVLDVLGPPDDPRSIEQMQDAMARERRGKPPYSRQTFSAKLNELAKLGLADGESGGPNDPKRWWRMPP
jgi:hypothetical protein